MSQSKEMFEFSHYYPSFEQQKFWDFFVDHEWYSQSEIMLGEITLENHVEGQAQGLGTIRRITIGNIDIVEEIVGFYVPKYFSYAVRDGMPVNNYQGEIFLEPQGNGLSLRYKGSFDSKFFGINWLFKFIFLSRMQKMAPVWAEGYKSYYDSKGQTE